MLPNQSSFVTVASNGQIHRDADRRALAQELAPLEQQKNAVDTVINAIDQAILQVEMYIVKNS